MFSVGASPFNSPSRQIYGGWTLADAGDNLWAKKEYYRMTSKYSRDAQARKQANKWLKMYRAAIRTDPGLKKRTRDAGLPFWESAIYPKMNDDQKARLYDAFINAPLSTDKNAQMWSRVLRKSPYPNYTILNRNPDLGVAWVQPTPNIPAIWDGWRTVNDLREDFKRMAGLGRNLSYTAAEVANEFGLDPNAVQAAMDRGRVKRGLF